MDDTIIPYDLPEVENHSFFFISQRIPPHLEAKIHSHDAWELYYVTHGHGKRTAGDTLWTFAEGDVVLIPPLMHHRWEYEPASADADGCVRYLMAAFSHQLVERCMAVFPELRRRLSGLDFPTDALLFGPESSHAIRQTLRQMEGMDDLCRLSAMFTLLPVIFTSSDYTYTGKPMRIERDVRRMQKISEYVMAHYVHPITLDEIARETGMNRSAFCSYFKRCKGMTFSQFVTAYRFNTACQLLKQSSKSISEICYLVGFNDFPHFVRVFTKAMGMSPTKYRKQHT